ncbi:hypothetical protein M407DRAFT_245146, partial [Tulasnella calospora MUT 4182]
MVDRVSLLFLSLSKQPQLQAHSNNRMPRSRKPCKFRADVSQTCPDREATLPIPKVSYLLHTRYNAGEHTYLLTAVASR